MERRTGRYHVRHALRPIFGSWIYVTKRSSISCAEEISACGTGSLTLRDTSFGERCIPHWPIALSVPSWHPASMRCMIVCGAHRVFHRKCYQFRLPCTHTVAMIFECNYEVQQTLEGCLLCARSSLCFERSRGVSL